MPRIPATTILLLRFRPNCRARNRAPAGAVTIPASARGTFHLPPIGGAGASLLPRLWTADEVTVRPNRNRIG